MCSILIERKRLGSAGIDLGTSTFDLGIPRRARVRVRLAIEAPEKLEGQARSFFGREPKDLGQDVGGRHSGIIADDLFRRRTSLLGAALMNWPMYERRMKLVPTTVLLIAIVGCGLFKKPKTPAEQAQEAVKMTGGKGEWIGHLDGSLSPGSGKDQDIAWSAQADKPLRFVGVADGQLCVAYVWDNQFFSSHDTVNEINEEFLKAVRSLSFEFDARANLDYPKTASWPVQPRNDVRSVTLDKSNRTNHVHTRTDGSTWTTENLYTRIHVCGDAPKLDTTTKFITVTRYMPASEKATPALFIWRLDSSIDSSLVSNIPAPATEADDPGRGPSTDAGPPTGTDAPTGTRNLVDELKEERRFGSFLKIAEAAGKIDELAHAQLTLIAPNDTAVGRWFGSGSAAFKKVLADKAKMLAFYNQHVIKGVVTKAGLASGPRNVSMLGGRKATLSFTENRLRIDGISLEDQVIDASNGVIFITGEVLQP